MTPDSAPTVQQLLAFYLEAGVDSALMDEPVNRLSDPDIMPAAPETTPPVRNLAAAAAPLPAARAETAAPEAAILSAREAARTAVSLEALRALLESFDGCALKSTATRLVFADGNPQARIMFVGEAPGREEDIEGLPFVGRSGKLLDRMIAAIGLDRSSAYIANVIPWRPPGNRTPTPQETQICLPFIQRQIELVDPDVLVTLGNPSTQTLLSTREGIMKTRGRWFDYDTGTRKIRALAVLQADGVAGSARDREGAGRGVFVGWAKAHLRRAHHARRSPFVDGHAEPVIGRAFARPVGFAHPRDRYELKRRAPHHEEYGSYGPFGRTIAQPTRNSGCRPVTSQSNARGTSGTRPGKRCASSAGGAPDVSEARHTTTPPDSLNFAGVSHGVRCGVATSNRCGRPPASEISVASCGSPVTARRRWLVRRSKLSPKKRAISRPGIEVATSALPAQGRKAVVAATATAGAITANAQTERNSRWRRSGIKSPLATIAASPDIMRAIPAPPATRSRLNRPESRIPASAGAMAKK
jgi:uracil-DNA glycosylase